MAEKTTLARPYALAAFKVASERGQLEPWTEMLAFLAAVVDDATMKRIIADPRVEWEAQAKLIIDIAGDRLAQDGQNLVKVLAENGRLELVPEIRAVYEDERARAEKRQKVEVASAYKLTARFETLIVDAMKRRLGCEVDLDSRIDRSLIGGVIIRAGDMVIDVSLRGRLQGLATALG